MSGSNGTGVIPITRKGRKKFAFEGGEPFEVDVVKVWDDWLATEQSYRVTNPEDSKTTIIPPDALTSFRQARVAYVQGLSGVQDISEAEAIEFLVKVGDEVADLRVFFRPRSAKEQSLPESTKTVVFSQ